MESQGYEIPETILQHEKREEDAATGRDQAREGRPTAVEEPANDVGNGEETGTGNAGKHQGDRSKGKSNDICGKKKKTSEAMRADNQLGVLAQRTCVVVLCRSQWREFGPALSMFA